ncbi:MAG: DNA-processing protein DprA [Patescibacteria group bacterium]|nr:DNA-processing protein DprA [Patescibacteria group bacterium]
MHEAFYYNALAIGLKGNHGKLAKLFEKHRSWKESWAATKDAPDPEQSFAPVAKLGVRLILKDDPEYPALLREIPFPPHGLYVLGDIAYAQPAIAVVGTRAATPHGKTLAKSFATALAGAGVPIISGLALGVDAEAHRGALDVGGKTIAILGTPLDYIYPRAHVRLADEILKSGGAIVSEFAFGHGYNPSNFLVRNRIISGLSTGALIIEAPERSGSLATARFALEQNRDIFVIPGSTQLTNYKGSHALIKSGAMLVTEPEDILEHYGLTEHQGASPEDLVTGDERDIVIAIRDAGGSATADAIAEKTGKDITEVNQALALLSIKGIIKELGQQYCIA